MKKYAIIISVNQNANFDIGRKDLGSIIAHAAHIEKEGAVLYDVVIPGNDENIHNTDSFPHEDKKIKTGYFYNVSEKAVTHVFKNKYIKTYSEIKDDRQEKYIPPPREEYFKEYPENYYWIKITSIHHLKKYHSLKDFKKIKDDKSIERLQNYSIIYDPEFAYMPEKITMKGAINDYITDNLIATKMHEQDIENLFYYLLAPGTDFKDRQYSFKKAGRLDLFIKSNGNYIVYELKKGIADLTILNQIKRYMKACSKKHHIYKSNIKGTIVAKGISSELKQAIKKEPNIKAKEYYFSINLK